MSELTTHEAADESTQVREKKDWLALKPLAFWDQIADPPNSEKYRTWREHFYLKYAVQAGGCWEWFGEYLSTSGYGRFTIDHDLPDGKREMFAVLAHRLSYLLEFDEHPGPILRHRCDNPPCVNPYHLLPGTRSDNAIDMVRRGRHPLLKLDEEKVAKIRILARRGWKYKKLAKLFEVTENNIGTIVRRESWAFVGDELEVLGLDSVHQLAV